MSFNCSIYVTLTINPKSSIPKKKNVSDIQLVIHNKTEGTTNKVFSSAPLEVKKGENRISIHLTEDIIVQGDVKLEFFNKPKMMRKVCC